MPPPVHTRVTAWIAFHRFFTYNYLQERIPKQDSGIKKLARNGLIGFCSSVVSDTCSNSIRVVKVYKQVRARTYMHEKTDRSSLHTRFHFLARVCVGERVLGLGDVRFRNPVAGS